MFDNRVLADDLNIVHLHEALSHFIPTSYATNIIQDRARFLEAASLLYIFDKLDAAKVHVIVLVSHCLVFVDRFRKILLRSNQLRSTKKERQMLIIV